MASCYSLSAVCSFKSLSLYILVFLTPARGGLFAEHGAATSTITCSRGTLTRLSCSSHELVPL